MAACQLCIIFWRRVPSTAGRGASQREITHKSVPLFIDTQGKNVPGRNNTLRTLKGEASGRSRLMWDRQDVSAVAAPQRACAGCKPSMQSSPPRELRSTLPPCRLTVRHDPARHAHLTQLQPANRPSSTAPSSLRHWLLLRHPPALPPAVHRLPERAVLHGRRRGGGPHPRPRHQQRAGKWRGKGAAVVLRLR